jgi:hypothetical protein
MKPYKLAVLSAAVAGSLWNLNASAQFTTGDLILGFRTPGAANDMVVDIGTSGNLVSLATPTGSYAISGNFYSGTQFTASSLNFNNLYFSVFGNTLGNTLWVTANSTLQEHTAGNQSIAAGQFGAIASGALDAGGNYPANSANSSTVVIVPSGFSIGGGTDLSYTKGVLDPNTSADNFSYFPVVNEANTSAGFSSGTSPIYMNLYELDPYSNNNGPAGTQLGYFELDPNGSMSFNLGIAPVPEPGTWAMFGSGLLTLIAIRRMKNKK